jgi:hypothetical protein
MAPLRREIIAARQASKQAVDDLYDYARGTQAAVTPDRSLLRTVNSALDTYDVQDMPSLQRRVNELREMLSGESPQGLIITPQARRAAADVPLADLDKWRQRLNRNRPSGPDSAAQNAALSILRDTVDQWIDAKFDADMISGDPSALDAWKAARNEARRFKERFSDDKVVARFVDQEATPEEMRRWVFGASQAGFQPQAGDVVRRLRDIVGEDSPSFAALRDDAMLQVVGPLLEEKPRFGAFIKNYDNLVRGNQSAINALFIPEQRKALSEIRDFAAAIEKVDPTAPIRFDIPRFLSTALFGHGIAKAGLRVRVARDAVKALRQAGNDATRREIVAAIAGYDPYQPMILRPQAAAAGAAGRSVQETAEEDRKE